MGNLTETCSPWLCRFSPHCGSIGEVVGFTTCLTTSDKEEHEDSPFTGRHSLPAKHKKCASDSGQFCHILPQRRSSYLKHNCIAGESYIQEVNNHQRQRARIALQVSKLLSPRTLGSSRQSRLVVRADADGVYDVVAAARAKTGSPTVRSPFNISSEAMAYLQYGLMIHQIYQSCESVQALFQGLLETSLLSVATSKNSLFMGASRGQD